MPSIYGYGNNRNQPNDHDRYFLFDRTRIGSILDARIFEKIWEKFKEMIGDDKP
jgi:hypothetical protein